MDMFGFCYLIFYFDVVSIDGNYLATNVRSLTSFANTGNLLTPLILWFIDKNEWVHYTPIQQDGFEHQPYQSGLQLLTTETKGLLL